MDASSGLAGDGGSGWDDGGAITSIGGLTGLSPSKLQWKFQQSDTVDVGGVMGPTLAGFITQTPTTPPLNRSPVAQLMPVFGQYSLPFVQKS